MIILHTPYATRLLHANPKLLQGCYTVATQLLYGCYTVVSIWLLDFAGYKHIVGGNLKSKSASLSVCRDSDGRDPVARIQVTGREVWFELAPVRPAGQQASRSAGQATTTTGQ